jgi:hypothetical protein
MKPGHVQPFIAALQTEFFLDEEMIADSVLHNSSFNIIHRHSMFKVDVFIPLGSDFQLSQRFRAQKHIIVNQPEISAFFASPEDTILAKLELYRKGNKVSERQWRDVIGMLKVRAGDLDQEYLRKWAIELGVSDLLEKALKESE